MFDHRSESAFDHGAYAGGDPTLPIAGDSASVHHSSDRAIDAALRSVPLPKGLMTRLGKLAYTVSEESADQMDWLGC